MKGFHDVLNCIAALTDNPPYPFSGLTVTVHKSDWILLGEETDSGDLLRCCGSSTITCDSIKLVGVG